MKRQSRNFLLPIVTLLLGLAAAPAVRADSLTIALRQDADQLDPTLARTYVGRIVFAGLCDKLFDIDANLNIVPQLATGYKWDDPSTLTVTLRPNVQFQDGEKLDAASVVTTITRHQTMKGSFRRGELSPVKSVEVVDPLTVRFHLKAPYSPLLYQFTDRAGMIMAPAVLAKEGRDFARHPVCAGPFSFRERVAQDHITLDRFPGYWNAKAIHFDSVTYRILTDSSTRLANLQSGAVDMIEQVVPTDVPAVKADPNLVLMIGGGLGYNGISFNLDNGERSNTPMGKDARVRKAFELAIDRKALVHVVFNDMYAPTVQGIPANSPFADKTLTVPARDAARAKALLKEAGVPIPFPVELIAPNQPDLAQVAEVIQAMTAEAGFDVKIRLMEFASSLQAQTAGRFQAYIVGWSGRADPDGNLYGPYFTGGPRNASHYSSKEMDSLLSQARQVSDIAQRKEIYGKVSRLIEQDLPYMHLWTTANVMGLNHKLKGFVMVPDGMVRLQGMHFDKE